MLILPFYQLDNILVTDSIGLTHKQNKIASTH
jgi:hypothetical protein